MNEANADADDKLYQGSIGNLASAATVAASSFSMAVANPQHFIDQIPAERWELMAGRGSLQGVVSKQEPNWVEPASSGAATSEGELDVNQLAMLTSQGNESINISNKEKDASEQKDGNENKLICGKIQRLGDFVDTDAVGQPPSTTMTGTIRLTNSYSWHRLNFSSHLGPTKRLEFTVSNLQIPPSAHEPKKASTW